MLINIKTRHFHSSINHQEYLFHRTLITSYVCHVNIAKFLRTAVLWNTSRSSRLRMFFIIGEHLSVAAFVMWTLQKVFKNNFLYNNSQMQPPEMFYEKMCSLKFHKINRKAPVPQPHFSNVAGLRIATFLKRDSGTSAFRWILRNF